MSLNENQPSTTRNRLIIVVNTGRLMHRTASPRPRVSSGVAEADCVGSVGFMAGGMGGSGRGGGRRVGLERRRGGLDGHRGAVAQAALAAHRHGLPSLE